MDLASMNGLMEGNSKENGRIIKWKVGVYLRGQTIEDMKENILMIKKRDMECSSGQTEESMKENGRMESNTESVFIHLLQARQEKVSGQRVKE